MQMAFDARQPLEPWADFVKRATRIAEVAIEKVEIEEWTTTFFRKQWRWAARVARQDHDRWSRLAAEWDPGIDDKRHGFRRQARPRKRWDDDINAFLRTAPQNDTATDEQHNTTKPSWINLAKEPHWTTMENSFVNFARHHTTKTSNPNKTPITTNHNTTNTNTTTTPTTTTTTGRQS